MRLIIDADGLVRGTASGIVGLAPGEALVEAPVGFTSREHIGRARIVDGVLVPIAPPAPMRLAGPALALAIAAEFDRRIAAALLNKTGSMTREAVYLQNLAFRGTALTPEQLAEVAMFSAINAWEADMVDAREALITASDVTFADDAHWPAPPAGLVDFLKGF